MRQRVRVISTFFLSFVLVMGLCPAVALAEDDPVQQPDAPEVSAEAQAVVEAIGSLPAPEAITSADAAAIEQVRDSYNQLPLAQKAQVNNATILTQAESYLGAAVSSEQAEADKQAAQYVVRLNGALAMMPEDFEGCDEELLSLYAQQIEDSRAAYAALTDAQKVLVNNLDSVEVSEQEVGRQMIYLGLEDQESALAAGAEVQAMVVAALSADDPAALADARAAYSELSLPQRLYVPSGGDMALREQEYLAAEVEASLSAEQEAAYAVADMIAALPAQPAEADAQAIEDARAAYTALTSVQKAWITSDAYTLDAVEAAAGAVGAEEQPAPAPETEAEPAESEAGAENGGGEGDQVDLASAADTRVVALYYSLPHPKPGDTVPATVHVTTVPSGAAVSSTVEVDWFSGSQYPQTDVAAGSKFEAGKIYNFRLERPALKSGYTYDYTVHKYVNGKEAYSHASFGPLIANATTEVTTVNLTLDEPTIGGHPDIQAEVNFLPGGKGKKKIWVHWGYTIYGESGGHSWSDEVDITSKDTFQEGFRYWVRWNSSDFIDALPEGCYLDVDSSFYDVTINGSESHFFGPLYSYDITKHVGYGGKVTITGGGASMHPCSGTNVSFRTEPQVGYKLDSFNVTYVDPDTGDTVLLNVPNGGVKRVSGNGRAGTNSTYSFRMPEANVTISATFGVNKRSITKKVTGSGQLMLVGSDGKTAGQTRDTVKPTMNPQVGSNVYFKSIPSGGYKLSAFNVTFKDVNGATVKYTVQNGKITSHGNGLYSFVMPNYDVTLNGTFVKR